MTLSSSLLALTLLLSGAAPSFSPAFLWKAWPSARFVTTPAPCLDHATLVARLGELEARHPGRLSVEEVGRSVEGRAIHLLTLGKGPRRVLLWSRMHGDEPTATPALLDMADFLLSSADPAATALLDGATLLLVPMLNPDGAERYARPNSQGIDINRDALRLATPEGRLLKALRDRFHPELGFNLHDQDRRTTVGESGRLATVALLAVAGDAAGTMTPGRARARRVCAALVRTLQPFVPGGIARYDEDWNPRAFGDNLTAWGTPVVLLESGGRPAGWSYGHLTRLNFVGLLAALSGLVKDDLAGEDPQLYESLQRNRDGDRVDVLVSGGRVWQPGAGPPYRADIAFDLLDTDPVAAGCDNVTGLGTSTILAMGDGHALSAGRIVDATGRLVVPAFVVSIRGVDAGQWLEEEALGALGRLGVARIRWHVPPADRDASREMMARLGGHALPVVEVVGAESPLCLLEVNGPPSRPESTRLDEVLDSLTEGRWRPGASEQPLPEILRELTDCDRAEQAAPRLTPTAAASFLVLRQRLRAAPASAAVSPQPEPVQLGELAMDVVFINGREPVPVHE